jgi:hypothetical protein
MNLFVVLAATALNDLDLLAADIQNAYLNAPITENIRTILGAEFGHDLKRRKAIIVHALYELKSAGHLPKSPCSLHDWA